MTEEYALKISKFILKDKDSISVNSFTELFEINENGGSHFILLFKTLINLIYHGLMEFFLN